MKQNNKLTRFLGAITGILLSVLLMGIIEQGFKLDGSIKCLTAFLTTFFVMSVYLTLVPKIKKFWLYLLSVMVGGYLLSLPFPREVSIPVIPLIIVTVPLIVLIIVIERRIHK